MVYKLDIGNVERIAWNRIKNQNGLSLFGDKDKDKLMNVLDCRPLNINKQGPLTRVTNFARGKGFVENEKESPELANQKPLQKIVPGVVESVANYALGRGLVGTKDFQKSNQEQQIQNEQRGPVRTKPKERLFYVNPKTKFTPLPFDKPVSNRRQPTRAQINRLVKRQVRKQVGPVIRQKQVKGVYNSDYITDKKNNYYDKQNNLDYKLKNFENKMNNVLKGLI